jgi:opacity protein-like surface antigen
MKKLIMIAVFAVFSASSAISASLTPAIGISYNNAGFAAKGTEHNYDESGAIRATTSEHGAFAETYASVMVELGIGEYLAIGVDYVPGSISTPTNASKEGTAGRASPNDPGQATVSADFEKMATAYARLNLPMLGGTYLKFGITTADVIVNEKTVSGNKYKDTDTDGMTAGVGYAHDLANGVAIRAEVMVSEFDDVKADNGVAAGGNMNKVIITDMWGARGTISLVKSF